MIVTVDGVEFVPAGESLGPRGPRIGIGITTRNRADVFPKTYGEIVRLSPGIPIVVVDDASDIPVGGVNDVTRFEENVGIARAKNACLEALYAKGVEHFFLFDDDAYPLVEDWWLPYVESPEPHLMRIFEDLAGTQKLNDIRKIYEGDGHVAYTGPRGMMLYAHRSVLDRVGGMDVAYGKWGYEHGDWSNRIHNAGLTTWRFADVIGGEELIFSLDEHSAVNRLTLPAERQELVRQNVQRYKAEWNSSEFKAFMPPHDVMLTSWFTGKPDPQRGQTEIKGTEVALATLLKTLQKREVHIFTDTPTRDEDLGDGHHAHLVSLGADNVYFQRWISYWRWLRDHPEVRFVWCVDGTDVTLLGDPFALRPVTLYVGSEPASISKPWLRQHHPSKWVTKLIEQHSDGVLYNAGLVGGDRETVMEFLHEMIELWGTNQIDQFHKKDESLGIGDMGAFNAILYRPEWRNRVVTGPAVHTVFKAYEQTHETAIWAHK